MEKIKISDTNQMLTAGVIFMLLNASIVIQSIESVFSIVFMIALGVILTDKGWFDDNYHAVYCYDCPVYILYEWSVAGMKCAKRQFFALSESINFSAA